MSAPAQIQAFSPSSQETQLFFEATSWTQLVLTKMTSGTVVVGTSPNLAPINANLGIGLSSGEPFPLLVGPGTQLYCLASDDSQKLAFVAQPVPAPGGGGEVGMAAGEPAQSSGGTARVLTPTPLPGTRDPRLGPGVQRGRDRSDGFGRGL